MKNETESHDVRPITVEGVVEAASTGPEDGTYVRIRMVPRDVTKLLAAGAFCRIVQVKFEP